MTLFRLVLLIAFVVTISDAKKAKKKPKKGRKPSGGGFGGRGQGRPGTRSIVRNPNGADNGRQSGTACVAPTLPFATDSSAGSVVTEEVGKITDCWYNFWKDDSGYRGSKGFVSHFGVAGDIFSETTEFVQDDQAATGHSKFMVKAIVTQNLVSFASEIYDVEITGNTANSVTFRWTVDIRTKVGPSRGVQSIESTDTLVYDDNGVLVRQLAVSANGCRGGLLIGQIVGATASASAALGLFDDDADNFLTRNVDNPIKFVFLTLLSLVTICGALCVWLLYKACYAPYGKSVRYSPVDVSSGIDSNDDVYPLKA